MRTLTSFHYSNESVPKANDYLKNFSFIFYHQLKEPCRKLSKPQFPEGLALGLTGCLPVHLYNSVTRPSHISHLCHLKVSTSC